MRRGLLVAAMVGFCFGCRGGARPVRSPAQTRQPAQEGPLVAAAEPDVGVEIDVDVPLLEGGALSLRELRGRVVLLELGSASDPGWMAAQERWRALATAHAETLRVVSVVADPDPTRAQWTWEGVPSPLVCGWDPQGALAARLGVTRFPTRLILDANGRVITTIAGPDAEARVELAIREQLGEPSSQSRGAAGQVPRVSQRPAAGSD